MPRWIPSLLVLLLALACTPALPGAMMGDDEHANQPQDDEEIEQKSVEDLEKEAAAYRVEEVHHVPTKAEDEGALYHIRKARELLADHHLWLHDFRATRTAERGFRRYPYSRFAGTLLLVALEGYIARDRPQDELYTLLRIWFFLPDFNRTGEAMQMCLDAAERAQRFSRSVNLEAEDPHAVIKIRGHGSLTEVDKILRFLALHGDRETIAPKAELDLARSQLLSGTREDLYAARRSYEAFLEKYPDTPLTFDALVERALSYLVGYRGDDYDAGALTFAATIIDQAELETHGDAAKARTVQAYRRRIRLWQQDRDLRIARWYRSRGTFLIAPIVRPPGLVSWLDGARFYYNQVIVRDSSSRQARIAARELNALPQAGLPR